MQQKTNSVLPKWVALVVILSIIVAIAAVSIISVNLFGQDDKVSIFLTTEGFGEKDVENQLLTVHESDTVKDIFSLKYKEHYETYGRPLVNNNEFVDFLGCKASGEKRIVLYLNGERTLNVTQAFIGEGAQLKIVYVDR